MGTERAPGKSKQRREPRMLMQDDPTPRFLFRGDVYPFTGQRILRQDTTGLRAARREIARTNPGHSSLQDVSLWPGLAVSS